MNSGMGNGMKLKFLEGLKGKPPGAAGFSLHRLSCRPNSKPSALIAVTLLGHLRVEVECQLAPDWKRRGHIDSLGAIITTRRARYLTGFRDR